jgi:hypothetical protein
VQHPLIELFRLHRRIGARLEGQAVVSKNRGRGEVRELRAFPDARATIGKLVSAHGIPDEFTGHSQRDARAVRR